MKKNRDMGIWISVALYALCLAFPAYYIGDTHEPQSSLSLLLMGWLGPLDGHFSWFANLFYLLALIKYKKPNVSAGLGILALILALSFIAHERIIVSEAPTYKNIVGYGYGYFFWIAAIGQLSLTQILSINFKNSPPKVKAVKIIFYIGWFAICTSTFLYHYYLKEGSQNSLKQERNRVFFESCKTAKYAIFVKNEKTDSIYFHPDWGVEIKKWKDGKWHFGAVGVLGLGTLNSGMLKFYETADRDYAETGTYRRFYPKDHKSLKVDSIESSHSVITESRDLAKNLNIIESHILIKSLKNNRIIAEAKYVIDKTNGRFCAGRQDIDYFSTSKFVIEALNLEREYPSIYD
jgi:hypothetical protein